MKKNDLFLFILFSFITIVACAQNAEETDYEKYNLKGAVASSTTLVFNVKEEDGKIVKGSPALYIFGVIDQNRKLEFDQNGYLKALTRLNGDHSVFSREVYTYNQAHQLLTINYLNGKNELVSREVCQYNAKGKYNGRLYYDKDEQLVKKIINSFDTDEMPIVVKTYEVDTVSQDSTALTYNKDGLLLNQKKYTGNSLKTETSYQYNEKGQCIQINSYFDEAVVGIVTYEYDEMENLITTESFGNTEKINPTTSTTYVYDSEQRLIKKTYKNIYNSSKVFAYTFLYENDAHQNWIKKIIYESGKPIYWVERTISYYD